MPSSRLFLNNLAAKRATWQHTYRLRDAIVKVKAVNSTTNLVAEFYCIGAKT